MPGALREVTLLIDKECGTCEGKGEVDEKKYLILTGGFSPCQTCKTKGCVKCSNFGYLKTVKSIQPTTRKETA